jgi:tyrosinase
LSYFALSAFLQVVCGASIRKAWHDTSCEDRRAYLNAVELLYKLPADNDLAIPNYAAFVTLHADSMNRAYAHGIDDGPFLPWHRWFVWKFEEALQRVSNSCVTVPYWDWSRDKGKEMESSVLTADAFGSTSGIDSIDGCVTDGICSKHGFWNKTVRTGGCLKR